QSCAYGQGFEFRTKTNGKNRSFRMAHIKTSFLEFSLKYVRVPPEFLPKSRVLLDNVQAGSGCGNGGRRQCRRKNKRATFINQEISHGTTTGNKSSERPQGFTQGTHLNINILPSSLHEPPICKVFTGSPASSS